MKFCDRCYEEYEDDEIVKFDKESPKWICLPCKWEFDNRLKFFLIEFFNSQPERSKREDYINPYAQEFQIALSKALKEEIEDEYRCGTLNIIEI